MIRIIFVVALALWGAGAIAQTTVDLNINQARNIATQALLSNDPALALQIAEAILTQIPDDRTALIVVAAAAPQVGDPDRGRTAGARAFAVSQTDAQKYEAARLTALAAANDQRYTLATFWLRRALTVAPNEAERTRTLTDARGVTRLNPWSTGLSFSLAPSSNLNGGAEDEASTAPGIPTGTLSEDALALAGWRASLGFNTRYRLRQSQSSRTSVALQYRGGRVRITEDTDNDIPDEAFATNYYELSLRHEMTLERGALTLNASRGLFEYRDLDLRAQTTDYDKYDIWRLGLDRQIPLNARTFVSFSVGREWQEYLNLSIGEVNRVTVGTGIAYQLDGGDRISANLTIVDNEGDTNVNYTSQDLTLSGSYRWAEPIGPISLSIGGGLRWSAYSEYLVFNPNVFAFVPIPGGRQDRTVFANANIGFPDVSYAGFTPGLRIDVSRANSNVSRFDRTTFSAGLTISSQF